MPPSKKGLLSTLGTIALGVSVAMGSSGLANDEQRFADLCSWIQQENDVQRLESIIDRLVRNDEECYFDPVTGQNYCKICLSLAAERLVTLSATAAGGYAFQ